MIHSAYKKSEIARRYYALATGEAITLQEASNRWRMLRHPDKDIIKKVLKTIEREQRETL